ncbi:MAG: hypothetical protein A2Z25_21000 [Planctomycetes bacterium RBG_16_55_9]|nr:MAG: hypothetical protein A2Z25_21000 [Planctomycetes bacterium RBG_16_55_9]
MSEEDEVDRGNMKVGLLGVSFGTGNLGVSALAESSIKVILNRWPDAQITLIGIGYEPQRYSLSLAGRDVSVEILPIRLSKNIFLPYHFLWLVFYGLLAKLLPVRWFENHVASRNPYFKILYETDVVLDITAGDSFSDIYGWKRFLVGFLQKWLVIFLGKPFILLPQTYGPFKGKLARRLARHVMKRARVVYARDREGVEYAKKLLDVHKENGKIRFAPDVAFVLDPREPGKMDLGALDSVRTEHSIVVGLNVSGLLFSGGYTRNNMFGLKTDYRELIDGVVDYLMTDQRTLILLVPHVFTPDRLLEDDPHACRQVYERWNEKYSGRIFLAQGGYNHNDIKFIIGLCDFFIGSRMHSCIAAMSQSIPAVGIAYSKKFKGVFDSVGLGHCVADVYQCDKDELLSIVKAAFMDRDPIRTHLSEVLPDVKANILNLLAIVNTAQAEERLIGACCGEHEEQTD